MPYITIADIVNQLNTLLQAACEEWASWQKNPIPNPNFPFNNQWEKEKERRRKETWHYQIAAGGILWLAFENYYQQLDGRLRAIIGSWRGSDRAFYNPNWAKGRSFQDICIHWLGDAFDGMDYNWKRSLSGEMLATIQAIELLAQYLKDIEQVQD